MRMGCCDAEESPSPVSRSAPIRAAPLEVSANSNNQVLAVERCRQLYLEGRLEGFEILKPAAVFSSPDDAQASRVATGGGKNAMRPGSIDLSAKLLHTTQPAEDTVVKTLPAAGQSADSRSEGITDTQGRSNELQLLYAELHRRMVRSKAEEATTQQPQQLQSSVNGASPSAEADLRASSHSKVALQLPDRATWVKL